MYIACKTQEENCNSPISLCWNTSNERTKITMIEKIAKSRENAVTIILIVDS